MKIKFIGTGSAFTMKNFQTNFIINEGGKNLLIDAGMDIRFALRDAGVSIKEINALYITHQHADHIGGVEYIAFLKYFDPTQEIIPLFINRKLSSDMWSDSLRGGLASIQGKVVGLDDYFDVHRINQNSGFEWQGIRFDIVQAVHIMNGYSIVPSFGLMMRKPKCPVIYYPGDTQFNPNQIKDFYNQADIIIQDCETLEGFRSGVHAHFDELVTLDPLIKKKMFLLHYQDNVIENKVEWTKKARDAGFKGFIPKGMEMKIPEAI